MRSRIEEGFRRRFRELLALVRPRRLELGVEVLLRRARERSRDERVPMVRALAQVYAGARKRVERRLVHTGACSVMRPTWTRFQEGEPPRFLCDACLGGLARWLRVAGYEARPSEVTDDGELVEVARRAGLVLLTSDSELMERRLVREGTVLALWVPSGLTLPEQLAMVLCDLGLARRAPRCMACGGELESVDKEAVRSRIPPRTALWKEQYFRCAGCDQLFWAGTHWERIVRALEAVAGP